MSAIEVVFIGISILAQDEHYLFNELSQAKDGLESSDYEAK